MTTPTTPPPGSPEAVILAAKKYRDAALTLAAHEVQCSTCAAGAECRPSAKLWLAELAARTELFSVLAMAEQETERQP